MNLDDRLYSSTEVAQILGVSLRSVYRYLEDGSLKADIKTATGRHRFTKNNVLEFLYPDSVSRGKAYETDIKFDVDSKSRLATAFSDGQDQNSPVSENRQAFQYNPVAKSAKKAPEPGVSGQIGTSASSAQPGESGAVDWLARFRAAQQARTRDRGSSVVPSQYAADASQSALSNQQAGAAPQPVSSTIDNSANAPDDVFGGSSKPTAAFDSSAPQGVGSAKIPQPVEDEEPKVEAVDWLARFRAAKEELEKSKNQQQIPLQPQPSQAYTSSATQPTPSQPIQYNIPQQTQNQPVQQYPQQPVQPQTSVVSQPPLTQPTQSQYTQPQSQSPQANAYQQVGNQVGYTPAQTPVYQAPVQSQYTQPQPQPQPQAVSSYQQAPQQPQEVRPQAPQVQASQPIQSFVQAKPEPRQEVSDSSGYFNYYVSGLSGLKELAHSLNKSANTSLIPYCFTMYAGMSLYKSIKPFSILHAYIKPEHKSFFEKALQLKSSDRDSAQLCLITSDDKVVFETMKEMHGLKVASLVRLRKDLLDAGEDGLAGELDMVQG